MDISCPKCDSTILLVNDTFVEGLTCPDCHRHIDADDVIEICVSEAETLTVDNDEHFVPEPDDRIGRFRIDSEVGRGGFGSVFKAYDMQLERYVALKIPRSAKYNRRLADSFLREAKAAAKIRDSNIVSVHEIGRDHGRIFIVSDFIDGDTLAVWRRAEKPCQIRSAAIIGKLASAIHKAHEAGIVHRDLKPGNVIVDEFDQPHITDFGLAKNEELDEFVDEGKVVGTPAYMSPEQASGRAFEVDCKSDVYSLGVMLYELITQKRPFEGTPPVIISRVIRGEKLSPRQLEQRIDSELEQICLRAMKTEVHERFESALELSDRLDSFVARMERRNLTRSSSRISVEGLLQNAIIGIACVLAILGLGMAPSLSASNQSAGLLSMPSDAPVRTFFDVLSPGGDSITDELTSVTVLWHPDYIVYGIVEPIEFGVYTQNGDGKPYDVLLQAGEYTFSVDHPIYGHIEASRTVPTPENHLVLEGIRAKCWTRNINGAVVIPSIQFVGFEMVDHKDLILVDGQRLVRIEEGIFFSGHDDPDYCMQRPDGLPQLPFVVKTIQEFHIARQEVTVEQFLDVMGYLPELMLLRFGEDDIPSNVPVTNVTFYEAQEYCERVGGRLPRWDEYVFVATNGGLTKFPWGDDEIYLESGWLTGPVGTESYDRTKHATPIEGLFSLSVEWTSDTYVPDSRMSMPGTYQQMPGTDIISDGMLQLALHSCKVVVGGDSNARTAKFDMVHSVGSARCFFDCYKAKRLGDNHGFRVAK